MNKTKPTKKRRIRVRNLVIRITLVFAFAVIVLFSIENLVIPVLTNTSINVEHGEHTTSNVGLALILTEEIEMPLDLQVIQSLRQEYGESVIRVALRGAILSGMELERTAERICVTRLWIAEPLSKAEISTQTDINPELLDSINEIPVERKLHFDFENFCAVRGTREIRTSDEVITMSGVLPFSTGLSPYYYPFDTRTLDLEIWVETEIQYEDGSTEQHIIAPNVHTQHKLPDWQLHLFQEQITPEHRDHPIARSQLSLQRSFASRLLTAMLLLSLFVIIILLGFTNQIDGFIQASVAVLLTLLGIQDLLIPAAISETNIVNQIILTLYVLFALAVLSRLTLRPIWDHTRVSDVEDEDENQGDET